LLLIRMAHRENSNSQIKVWLAECHGGLTEARLRSLTLPRAGRTARQVSNELVGLRLAFGDWTIENTVMKLGAKRHLELAKRHLEKVQNAWDSPTDWSDLAIYGFYCLEQAVMAAATESGLRGRKQHRDKVQLANTLHKKNGLPDIAKLLTHLHRAQKYASYGDVKPPPLDPQDLASEIEEYVEAVTEFVR